MSGILLLEQALNGLQLGLMLFLLAAGLTLVFGIMDMVQPGPWFAVHGGRLPDRHSRRKPPARSGGAWLRVCRAPPYSACCWRCRVLRRLYRRDHVVAGAGDLCHSADVQRRRAHDLGSQPLSLNPPAALSGPVELLPGFFYPAFRLLIIVCRLGCGAAALPAGDPHPAGHAGACRRFQPRHGHGHGHQRAALVHCWCSAWARALCALAGGMLGPLLAVQVGMGESILILAFVVIVIGGIGSIRGALVGRTAGGHGGHRRAHPAAHGVRVAVRPQRWRPMLAPAVASILIYVLMAAVLFFKPRGLFPAPWLIRTTPAPRCTTHCTCALHSLVVSGAAGPAAAHGWLCTREFYVTLATRIADFRPCGQQPEPDSGLRRLGAASVMRPLSARAPTPWAS